MRIGIILGTRPEVIKMSPIIRAIEPLNYQEEACILGVPCVTLRDGTERPETIAVGERILEISRCWCRG